MPVVTKDTTLAVVYRTIHSNPVSSLRGNPQNTGYLLDKDCSVRLIDAAAARLLEKFLTAGHRENED
ncbi:UNVERIFIED_CONTAM: hypothetical protein FKN15_015656 [Acipenser sinensis]